MAEQELVSALARPNPFVTLDYFPYTCAGRQHRQLQGFPVCSVVARNTNTISFQLGLSWGLPESICVVSKPGTLKQMERPLNDTVSIVGGPFCGEMVARRVVLYEYSLKCKPAHCLSAFLHSNLPMNANESCLKSRGGEWAP